MSSGLRWYEYVLPLVPLALGVASLGVLGIGLGAAGSAVSLAIVRTSMTRRAKVAGCVGSMIGAFALWTVLAVLMR